MTLETKPKENKNKKKHAITHDKNNGERTCNKTCVRSSGNDIAVASETDDSTVFLISVGWTIPD